MEKKGLVKKIFINVFSLEKIITGSSMKSGFWIHREFQILTES